MPSGFENIVQGYRPQEWSATGGSDAGATYGSVGSPAIPLTEHLQVIPAIENFLKLKDGGYTITPSVTAQYGIPVGLEGLFSLGAGVERQLGNLPWQDNRTHVYGGANYSTQFDSNPLVDAVVGYLNRK